MRAFLRSLETWRKWLLVGLCVFHLAAVGVVLRAGAQEQESISGYVGEQTKIIRSYHLDRSGLGSSNLCDTSIGCPTLGIYFDDSVAATYTPEIGAAYVMTVNGNPTRVAAGTWPAGFSGSPGYAWRLDGTGDYLSLADDPAFEVPDFSVFVCFVPRAGLAVNDTLAAKARPATNERSWYVYHSMATSVTLLISDDGTTGAGHYAAVAKATSIASGRLTCATASYDYVADGSSIGSVWVDELAVATSNVMDGPPFNGTADFTIGAKHGGGEDTLSDVLVAAYYPGVLTAADHLRLSRRYRGLYDGSGSQVVSVVNAAPPALQVAGPEDGVEPFIVEQPANTTMLGKTASCSGLYGPSAISNLVQYWSFETWAAGSPTGWTEVATSTGDAVQNTTTFAHGSSSVQLVNADADDEITIKGACMTVTGGASYNLSWVDKLLSGTGSLDVLIYEDDSADCGSPTGHTLIGVVPILNRWSERVTPYTMQAGTIRAQLWFTAPAGAAQSTVVDRAHLKPGALAADAFCPSPAAATGVCATSVTSHASALPANPGTIELTACTPWAGAELPEGAYFWNDGIGTGGANRIGMAVSYVTDEMFWQVYDGAVAIKYIAPNTSNWEASTAYTVRAYWDGAGGLGITCPVGTWYTTTVGAGTGIRSAAQAVTYLCGSNSAGTDVWLTGVTYRRGSGQ